MWESLEKTNLYLYNNFPVTDHWKLERRYLFIHTPQSAAGECSRERLRGVVFGSRGSGFYVWLELYEAVA